MTETGKPSDEPGPGGGFERGSVSGRRSVSRNLVDMLSSQAITWVLSTAVTAIQPRYLGDVGQGQLRLAYSMWLIVDVLASFGTSTFLTLEIAKNRDRGLSLLSPVLVCRGVGYVFGWLAVSMYLAVSGADGRLIAVMVLIGTFTSFTTIAATARSALVGLEQMRYPAMADIASKLLSSVAIIVALLLGGDVVTVAAISVVAAAVNATLMFRFLRPFRGSAALRSARVPVLAVAVGGFSYLIADAALIIYQQIDTVVMSTLVDDAQLGWYAAADQLFASLLFVPTILMITLFPVFGRLKEEDPERLRSIVSRAITSLLLLSVPVGLGTVAVGQPVALLLFGSQFEGAGEVLSVLGVVIIITSETILIGRYAIAIGRQRFWNTLMIAGIVITVPLDMVLVPWTDDRYGNGAIGGALAYIVTETLMLVIGTWKFARSALVPSTGLRAAKILLAGGLMLLAVWPLRDEFLLLPIAAGAVVYPLALVLTRALGPEEQRLIERAAGMLRRLR